jgi:hypothetical protein
LLDTSRNGGIFSGRRPNISGGETRLHAATATMHFQLNPRPLSFSPLAAYFPSRDGTHTLLHPASRFEVECGISGLSCSVWVSGWRWRGRSGTCEWIAVSVGIQSVSHNSGNSACTLTRQTSNGHWYAALQSCPLINPLTHTVPPTFHRSRTCVAVRTQVGCLVATLHPLDHLFYRSRWRRQFSGDGSISPGKDHANRHCGGQKARH